MKTLLTLILVAMLAMVGCAYGPAEDEAATDEATADEEESLSDIVEDAMDVIEEDVAEGEAAE